LGSALRRRCASGSVALEPTAVSDRKSSQEIAETRKLKKEVTDLRRANEILKSASAFFAAKLDRRRRHYGPRVRPPSKRALGDAEIVALIAEARDHKFRVRFGPARCVCTCPHMT
jgi:hypothetical protein